MMQDARSRMQEAGCRMQEAGCKKQGSLGVAVEDWTSLQNYARNSKIC
jgi:hypothetical protein